MRVPSFLLTEIVIQNPCLNTRVRCYELVIAIDKVVDSDDEFPKLRQLKVYFKKSLRGKNNWGSQEIVNKLKTAIRRVYYR